MFFSNSLVPFSPNSRPSVSYKTIDLFGISILLTPLVAGLELLILATFSPNTLLTIELLPTPVTPITRTFGFFISFSKFLHSLLNFSSKSFSCLLEILFIYLFYKFFRDNFILSPLLFNSIINNT